MLSIVQRASRIRSTPCVKLINRGIWLRAKMHPINFPGQGVRPLPLQYPKVNPKRQEWATITTANNIIKLRELEDELGEPPIENLQEDSEAMRIMLRACAHGVAKDPAKYLEAFKEWHLKEPEACQWLFKYMTVVLEYKPSEDMYAYLLASCKKDAESTLMYSNLIVEFYKHLHKENITTYLPSYFKAEETEITPFSAVLPHILNRLGSIGLYSDAWRIASVESPIIFGGDENYLQNPEQFFPLSNNFVLAVSSLFKIAETPEQKELCLSHLKYFDLYRCENISESDRKKEIAHQIYSAAIVSLAPEWDTDKPTFASYQNPMEVFDSMRVNNYLRPISVHNALLKAMLMSNKPEDEIKERFLTMNEQFVLDQESYSNVLSLFTADECLDYFIHVKKHVEKPSAAMYEGVISAFGKEGRWAEAVDIFEEYEKAAHINHAEECRPAVGFVQYDYERQWLKHVDEKGCLFEEPPLSKEEKAEASRRERRRRLKALLPRPNKIKLLPPNHYDRPRY